MTKRTRKLWAGIGAVTVVSLSIGPPADAQSPDKPATPSTSGSALTTAKAGEAYLTDGGPKDTRIRVARDSLLLRGHLRVAGELADLGRWREAQAHVTRMSGKLYGRLDRYITSHKSPPFLTELNALATALTAEDLALSKREAAAVARKLDAHERFYERFMIGASKTSFATKALVEVIEAARVDYAASLDGQRFVKPFSYQEGRGFIGHAEHVLARDAQAFRLIDRVKLADLTRALDELKVAWPSAATPDMPVLTAAEVARRADAFKAAAVRFY